MQDQTGIPLPSLLGVPLFYFHSFADPFCDNEHCFCHLGDKERMKQVCIQIIEGKVELLEAFEFTGREV